MVDGRIVMQDRAIATINEECRRRRPNRMTPCGPEQMKQTLCRVSEQETSTC